MEIGGQGKSVKYAVEGQEVKKDVSVNISSSDLAGVLKVIDTLYKTSHDGFCKLTSKYLTVHHNFDLSLHL